MFERITSPGHDRSRSLGGLANAWIAHFLVHGPGDIQGTLLTTAGIPLTDELALLNLDLYALNAEGRRLYDAAFYSRPKGADKSGHAARLAMFEALGPCRFAGWAEGGEVFEWMDFRYRYEPGEPMGRRVTYPLIRLLATEEGQVGNVFQAVYYNLTEGPLREAFPRRDDVGLTRVNIPNGGQIIPSTASSAAKDGGKESFVVADETHLYTLHELQRMYSTVTRNLTKRREAEPWAFETSTMYLPGENSIAEKSHELAQQIRDGKSRRPRFLFDHRQAPADVDLANEESLLAGLREAYGDAAEYMALDRIVADIWNPKNDVADSRRYFLNQVTAHSEAWVDPQEWDAIARTGYRPAEGSCITLGFDGSLTDDHSALIGCEADTGHLFTIGIWNPADYDGEAPRELIDASVAEAFRQWDVVGFYADRQHWESYIDKWELELADNLCVKSSQRHPIQWDMSGKKSEEEGALNGQKAVVRAVEGFHAAIVESARMIRSLSPGTSDEEHDALLEQLPLTHDGDRRFREHVLNARRRVVRGIGVTFGKEHAGSARKIDATAAAMLARQCRQDYRALPEDRHRRKSYGWLVR